VTLRQRPGTAKGVLFVTLEDESGYTNVIIWPSLLERQRKEALGASLLAVYGVWQRQGEVTHLVAQRLVDLSHLLGSLDLPPANSAGRSLVKFVFGEEDEHEEALYGRTDHRFSEGSRGRQAGQRVVQAIRVQ
jgi:error-prone DNA polymerase